MGIRRIEDLLEDKKKKTSGSSEEQLRDTFNNASKLLINRFMQDVLSGDKEIESTADLARLFSIYLQVNGINEGMSGAEGALPEISPGRLEILEEVLPTSKTVVEGEEETIVDLDKLADISAEELAVMLSKTEEQMNLENEATF